MKLRTEAIIANILMISGLVGIYFQYFAGEQPLAVLIVFHIVFIWANKLYYWPWSKLK